MQTKNLIIFFVLLLVIVFGWQFFVNWRWPPKEKSPSAEQCARAVGLWGLGSPAAPGLDNAGRLAAEAWLVGKTPQELTELASLSAKAQAPPEVIVEKKPKPKPKPQRRQAEDIPLGDDSFNLKLTLTSEGAGVRELILTRFKEADRYGRYKGDQLPLIPNTGEPSFLLYHYDPEDDKAPVRPWETLGKLVWKHGAKRADGENGEQSVSFETPEEWDEQNGIHITKTYSLKRADYHLGLSIKIRGTRAAGKVQKFRYQIAGPRALPIEGDWYTPTYRNALIGRQSKDGDVERYMEDSRQVALWGGGDAVRRSDKQIRYAAVGIQSFASAIAVEPAREQPTKRDDFIEWARATLERQGAKGRVRKIAGDHSSFELAGADKADYTFSSAVHMTGTPIGKLQLGEEIAVAYTKRGDQLEAVEINTGEEARRIIFEDITVRVASQVLELEPGAEVEHKYLLYNGPLKVRLLGDVPGVSEAAVTRYTDELHLYTFTDQASPGVFGTIGKYTGMTRATIFFTNIMHYLLGFLHKYIPSYGVCIILLTVIVRLGMFPISRRQSIASRKMQARMQKLSPEMKKIREKYKNDFAATSAAQQELYRRHGINPFGQLGGCLLIFLQMPIFLGLYYCLQESIHFRLEQFLTPWWIRNLAAPDMLIWWSEKIPWISTPDSHGSFLYLGPYFNILPVIAVALMLVQQKLTMPPPADEQAEFSMKMMKWMMVVMGVMFYKMPAGLCLYFIATSLWGLAERKLLPKTAPATEPPAGGDGKQKASPIKSGPDGASPKSNGFFRKMRDRWDELLRQAAKDPQARKKKK